VLAKAGIFVHTVMEKTVTDPAQFQKVWSEELKAQNMTFEEVRVVNSLKYQAEDMAQRLNTAIVCWQATPRTELKIDLGPLIVVLDLVLFMEKNTPLGGILIDHKIQSKTKKNAAKVKHQLNFYAMVLFAAYPELAQLKTGCSYLMGGIIEFNKVLHRDTDFPRLEKYWKKRFMAAARAMHDLSESETGIFPIPSRKVDACTWCQVLECPKKKKRSRNKKQK
jgi:hypothetical protein